MQYIQNTLQKGKLILLALLFVACSGEKAQPVVSESDKQKQGSSPFSFEQISSDHSNVSFVNEIVEDDSLNYVKYMHIYQGAGLATADFNNDGLIDIYAVSNYGANELYFNRGNFVFEKAPASSGVASPDGWSTGVSIVDINNDGFADIYLCKSGWFDEELKRNQLFVNNGDGTFSEQAQAYGLDIGMNSTQATFFDYDRDGDLDAYIVNHSADFSLTTTTTDLKALKKEAYWDNFGAFDLLLRNDNGVYVDVSEEAGIYDIAFGLNVIAADINGDGWTDIYVSNDFLDPDTYYENNRDGTFTDKTAETFPHISFYGMGSDVGDINNDGNLDLIVLDMAAPDHYRSKTLMPSMDADLFRTMTRDGYHFQYMRNSLQLNSGIGEFQEIAQYAGVSKTDWSWTPLFGDFDGDGLSDLFVTNGILKDVTNNDANNSVMDDGRLTVSWEQLNSALPSTKLKNFVFRNTGNSKYANVSSASGLDFEGFSHGAVLADFDNDGAVDIAVNNMNAELGLFKNTTQQIEQPLTIQLEGSAKNINGVGASILVGSGDDQQVHVVQPTRGYLSSMYNPNTTVSVDKTVPVRVIWQDGYVSDTIVAPSDRPVVIRHAQANWNPDVASPSAVDAENVLLEDVYDLPAVTHKEPTWKAEFDKEILLPHRLSQNGPCLAVADMNNDGFDDVFLGGGAGNPPTLLLSNDAGSLDVSEQPALFKDLVHEDVAAVFVDVNNDGWLDLFVGSGSTEFGENHVLLQDRLYMNRTGKLEKVTLPENRSVSRAVCSGDFDGDGDYDVFVGSGSIPGRYPLASDSYILTNQDGVLVPGAILQSTDLGIVTAATAADIDGDGKKDLITVGEWEQPTILVQQEGKIVRQSIAGVDENLAGWWRDVVVADVDGNGEMDIICGNVGINQKFKASQDKPFNVFYHDFDGNGQGDIVLAQENKGELLPVRGLECSSQQMPMVAENHASFESFATSSLEDIYTAEKLEEAYHKEAYEFHSGVLYQVNGEFHWQKLPWQAQLSPARGIVAADVNADGTQDLLLVGDDFHTEVETTRLDAGIGVVLLGGTEGDFEAISAEQARFWAPGDQRSVAVVHLANGDFVAVASNSGPLVWKKMKKNSP